MTASTNCLPRVRRVVLLPAPGRERQPGIRRWRLARVGRGTVRPGGRLTDPSPGVRRRRPG